MLRCILIWLTFLYLLEMKTSFTIFKCNYLNFVIENYILPCNEKQWAYFTAYRYITFQAVKYAKETDTNYNPLKRF